MAYLIGGFKATELSKNLLKRFTADVGQNIQATPARKNKKEIKSHDRSVSRMKTVNTQKREKEGKCAFLIHSDSRINT